MTSKSTINGTTVGLLLIRFAAAFMLAASSLLVLLLLLRTFAFLQTFNWYLGPLSVAIGFVPIFLWYRRDAYPLGLLFCPAAYFLLRYLATLVSPLLP